MPDETRNYVPKLQAVKNIVASPEKYGLDARRHPGRAVLRRSCTISRKIDVKRAAELAEMPVDEFQYLNPHHNRPVIAGADEHAILLPIDRAELFAAKLELTDQPLVSWQAYRMQQGRDAGAGRGEVRAAGRDAARGQRHRARRRSCRRAHAAGAVAAADAEAEAALRHAVFTTVPQGRTFYYRVQRGDTLPAIAGRYGVTAQDLRGWNALGDDQRQGRAAAAHHQRPGAERQGCQARVGQDRRGDADQGCAGRQVGVEERQGDREGGGAAGTRRQRDREPLRRRIAGRSMTRRPGGRAVTAAA